MSDDRFNPEENPPPPTPCRLYIAPRQPDYVSTEEMLADIDRYERETGTGKYKRKRPALPLPEPQARDRGDGQFGIGDAEPEAVE